MTRRASLKAGDCLLTQPEPESSPLLTPPKNSPLNTRDAECNQFDINFQVPFTHRIRFTQDVSGQDFDVLADVLDPELSERAKVILVAERSIAAASASVSQLNEHLKRTAEIDLVTTPIILTGGEVIKNDTSAAKFVLQQINNFNLDRRSYVVAVGGGAFLDAVGYACAVAHRGVRLIRLPTTTLAQGDSGVGVKNAINYFNKKNWVGTFAVPWAVINDVSLLQTLPDREFRCGFAESVKVMALKDPAAFEWLCENASRIAERQMPVSAEAIKRSCLMHLRHITEGGDAFEALEARPLDFGHWSAHRLEAMSGYAVSHGEAVAIGVALDSIYSNLALGLPRTDTERILRCLHNLQLPLWSDVLSDESELLRGLEEFRQHLGGRLTLTMLKQIGHPVDIHEVDLELMHAAIVKLRSQDWTK